MAKKFKDYYDKECAILIADKIKSAYQKFDKNSFVKSVSEKIVDKEFLQRQDIFAEALEKYLTTDYARNLSILTEILGDELKNAEGMFTHGWWLWPIGRYVERNSLKDFDNSIEFIYELTKRFTGEFAIRPLLINHTKETLEILQKWSVDSNVHVRRLSSEGMRISLPWAQKTTAALNEFELFKKILTNLNSDKEKFVQKSVGNNLNDLYKIDKEKASEIINLWKNNSSKETLWIIKHGMRSLK